MRYISENKYNIRMERLPKDNPVNHQKQQVRRMNYEYAEWN